ncbi:MAG: radical SAM protein [Deltaproteobacteria bacterium]|uniref:Radical SAM protein n=1 Tax=Candidatus Zymogenus saltonus TaxID=2844893 RepID=A0A9D8KEA5_9DELT|nr:radical SAM protein [Candidatus Zymogenus saltonus]
MDHLTISFLLTRRCNARCRHCGAWPASKRSGAKPEADSDFDTSDISDFIDQIAETPKIEAVGLTGGEAFIVRDLLYCAVKRLRDKSIPYTIVTNAFWAKSLDAAREVLSDFRDTIGIGLSADTFHNEFIPIKNVVNAARAAESLKIPYIVRATMKADDTEEGLKTWFEEEGLPNLDIVQFAPVMYIGEATEKMAPEEFPDQNPIAPCLSLRTPFIVPGGDVYACCGEAANIEGEHPLHIGNMRETHLKDIIKRYDSDPFLKAIYTIGPRAMFDLLDERPETLRDELLLRSPCGTCRLLFEDMDRTERLSEILGEETSS